MTAYLPLAIVGRSCGLFGSSQPNIGALAGFSYNLAVCGLTPHRAAIFAIVRQSAANELLLKPRGRLMLSERQQSPNGNRA